MRVLTTCALAGALLIAACARTPQPAASLPGVGEKTVESRAPVGLVALRPRVAFSDGRSFVGGAAFFAYSAQRMPVAVTSAHLVSSNMRQAKVVSIELLNTATREPLARASGIVFAGTRENGLALVSDFAVLAIDRLPAGVEVLELADRAPSLGDEVVVYGCPADASAAQVAIRGRVTLRDSNRVEIEVAGDADTRALAGAPIVSVRTGIAIAVAQSSGTRGDRGVILATPAVGIRDELAKLSGQSVPLTSWKPPE